MSAIFIQRGAQLDYIPSDDVEQGDFITFGTVVGVAERPIKAGELGAISVFGVYQADKDDAEITAGAKVYLNSDGKITATAENNIPAGVAVEAAAAADATVKVLLK